MILLTSREISPAKSELITTRETARAREEAFFHARSCRLARPLPEKIFLLVWSIVFNIVEMFSQFIRSIISNSHVEMTGDESELNLSVGGAYPFYPLF